MQPTERSGGIHGELTAAFNEILRATQVALQTQPAVALKDHLLTIQQAADRGLSLLGIDPSGAAEATTAPPQADQPAVDWSAAHERAHRNEMLLKEMSRLFVGECPRLLDQIQAALEVGDRAQIRKASGKLKSSASIFAARVTVEAAAQLEQMAEAEPLPQVQPAFQTLRERAERVLQELQRFLETGTR